MLDLIVVARLELDQVAHQYLWYLSLLTSLSCQNRIHPFIIFSQPQQYLSQESLGKKVLHEVFIKVFSLILHYCVSELIFLKEPFNVHQIFILKTY